MYLFLCFEIYLFIAYYYSIFPLFSFINLFLYKYILFTIAVKGQAVNQLAFGGLPVKAELSLPAHMKMKSTI